MIPIPEVYLQRSRTGSRILEPGVANRVGKGTTKPYSISESVHLWQRFSGFLINLSLSSPVYLNFLESAVEPEIEYFLGLSAIG